MGTIAAAEYNEVTRPGWEAKKSSYDENVSSTLMSVALGSSVALYSLVLVELKRRVLLGRGPFLREEVLGTWMKPFFVLLFVVEIVVLVATLAALLRKLAKPLMQKSPWRTRGPVVLAGTAYFWAVTAQFGVLRYFSDGIDLTILRALGGGDPKAALVYARDELAGLLPGVLVALVVILAGGWVVRKYSYLVRSWFSKMWLTRVMSTWTGLLAANGVMVLSPLLVGTICSPLHYALQYNVAYRLYAASAAYLTDFDGDGYGFVGRPADFAPFDSSRHPYAVEIPGNGIDENGVGGDLPVAIWNHSVGPWDGAKLRRKNVLLIVMDSARYDLLDLEVDGAPAMPTLRNLPGERISMFSHAGYTVPSAGAFLNGAIAEQENGISLIDRFKALGYRTGVFSGQHEGFGGMAARTHMDQADIFSDARSFPREQRMYVSTAEGALTIPAPLVVAKFAEWFNSLDHSRPFFAYLNWQEMHFPYYYEGGPTPLINRPIPRAKILPENRDWLWRTYLNAARTLDEALARVLALLDQAGIRQETVIVVFGDHGEELFENGYLGHGVSLSYEQNATLCKLIHSDWEPPHKPLGLSDIGTLIHNALVRSPRDALPLGDEVLCYVGDAKTPVQIGLVTADGIVKYDFRKDLWTRQDRPGAGFARTDPVVPIIHRWESFVVKRLAGAPPTGR